MRNTPNFYSKRQFLSLEANLLYAFNALIENNVTDPSIFNSINEQTSNRYHIIAIASAIEHLAYKKMLNQENVLKVIANPEEAHNEARWLCKLIKHGLFNTHYANLIDIPDSKINAHILIILKKCGLLTPENIEKFQTMPEECHSRPIMLILDILRKISLATQENFDWLMKYQKNEHQVETMRLFSAKSFLNQKTFELILFSNLIVKNDFFELLEKNHFTLELVIKLLELGYQGESLPRLLNALNEAEQLNPKSIDQLHQWNKPFCPKTVAKVITELVRLKIYQNQALTSILSDAESYWNYLKTVTYLADRDKVKEMLDFFLQYRELSKSASLLCSAYSQLCDGSDTHENRLLLAKRPKDSIFIAHIFNEMNSQNIHNKEIVLKVGSAFLPILNFVLAQLNFYQLLNQSNFDKTVRIVRDIDKLVPIFKEKPITQKIFDAQIVKIENYQRSLLITMAAKKGTAESGSPNAFFRFFGHTKNDTQLTPNHPLGDANIVKHIAKFIR